MKTIKKEYYSNYGEFEKIVAEYGAIIDVTNAIVKARDNSTVNAFEDSVVYAYEGSTINAYKGSTIIALEDSTVYAYEGSTIIAHKDSTVYAQNGSRIIRTIKNNLTRNPQ